MPDVEYDTVSGMVLEDTFEVRVRNPGSSLSIDFTVTQIAFVINVLTHHCVKTDWKENMTEKQVFRATLPANVVPSICNNCTVHLQ